MIVTESSNNKTLTSANRIAKTVPHIAGLLASLYSISYFIGWKIETAYFYALGAPWAAHGLPTSILLESSFSIVLFFAITAFSAVMYLAQGIASSRGMEWAAVACVGLSVVLSITGHSESLGLSTNAAYKISMVEGFLFAVAAGLTLAELIAK